jgi:phosphoribosyl-ATP pyrophosphohydrolase/phosphoribosyl-AMP cyclohydrolase
MILPSIDVMNGRAVQLVGGAGEPTDVGDPLELVERFGRLGLVPIVDLDAALGRGQNTELIREMLRRARCRVGGGIRSVEAALDWLDAGADSIVLGTMARPEILRELPRERVIAALDARDGEVVDHGWTRGTGRRVEERIAELAPYVAGFLVTFVEREGRVQGTDLQRAADLRALCGACSLTVAGGVRSADEVRALHARHIDCVVGMAMYRGELDLMDAWTSVLKSDREDGLWPTVVCDVSGKALGPGLFQRRKPARSV